MRRVLLALLGGTSLVAGMACSSEPASCSPSGTELRIVALDTHRFDRDCLAAPAQRPFTIKFENRDLSSHGAHNISIRDGGSLFTGEVVPPDGHSTTYEVDAMEAGTYRFVSDVHPSMDGTFIVK